MNSHLLQSQRDPATQLLDLLRTDLTDYKANSFSCCSHYFFKYKANALDTEYILKTLNIIERKKEINGVEKAIELVSLIRFKLLEYTNKKFLEVKYVNHSEFQKSRALIEKNPALQKLIKEPSKHIYFKTLYNAAHSDVYNQCKQLIAKACMGKKFENNMEKYVRSISHTEYFVHDEHKIEACGLKYA